MSGGWSFLQILAASFSAALWLICHPFPCVQHTHSAGWVPTYNLNIQPILNAKTVSAKDQRFFCVISDFPLSPLSAASCVRRAGLNSVLRATSQADSEEAMMVDIHKVSGSILICSYEQLLC